jgi:hypothetical protein
MRRASHVACMSDMSNVYKILVGKLEENRLLGDLKLTWTDATKR